jgi:CheY-like chemotaxis protein
MGESSPPDQESRGAQERQQAEIRAALAMVSGGHARSVTISGFDFTGLSAELREAAAAQNLRLDLDCLAEGVWSARISARGATPNERSAAALPGPGDPPSPVALSQRVLLVEDDTTLAYFVATHLARHGIGVRAVKTEEAAEEALTGEPLGLILLDINLPERTGWSLLRSPAYVAAGRPATIIVSATNVRPSQLAEAGASGYLPKPFAMVALLDLVKRILAGSGNQLSHSAPGYQPDLPG